MSIWENLNEAVTEIALSETNNKNEVELQEAYINAMGPTDKVKKIKTVEIAEIISALSREIYKFFNPSTGRKIIKYDEKSNLIKIDTDFFNIKSANGFVSFLQNIIVDGTQIITDIKADLSNQRPKISLKGKLPKHSSESSFFFIAGKGSVNNTGGIKLNKGTKFETDFIVALDEYLSGDVYWEDIVVDNVCFGKYFKD
ncbi:MAG: hypothetical protein D4S01_05405 [Dehalococcoidia bacterium]|nr:MAG: hypothetical protein D4S01_05405 [Dehalococcoidia bacterium]